MNFSLSLLGGGKCAWLPSYAATKPCKKMKMSTWHHQTDCVRFADLQISRSWMFVMTLYNLLDNIIWIYSSFNSTLSLSLSLSLVKPHAIVVMSNVAWNNTVNVARNPHWNKSLVYNSPLSLSLSLSLPASISNSKVYSSSHPVSRLFAALHCSFTFASVRTLPSSCLIQMLASLYMMASGEITRK